MEDYVKRKTPAAKQAPAPVLRQEANPGAEKPEKPAVAPPAKRVPPHGPAVDFVCEDDVKEALSRQCKIVVNARTIITPSARDIGEGKSVFFWK